MCVLETLVFAGEGVGDVVIDTVVTVTRNGYVRCLVGFYMDFISFLY